MLSSHAVLPAFLVQVPPFLDGMLTLMDAMIAWMMIAWMWCRRTAASSACLCLPRWGPLLATPLSSLLSYFQPVLCACAPVTAACARARAA
eukprot:102938-Rhodomonas_salina.1